MAANRNSDMRLIHYSDKHLEAVHSVKQGGPGSGRLRWKPAGLWVSPPGEDDWKSWCEAEEFALNSLTHPTEVHLKPGANVLLIENEDQLCAFNARYKTAFDILPTRAVIDWKQVALDHDGIIIAPYQYQSRLENDFFWYYSWDCASGAIWNSEAVSHLIPLPVEPRPSAVALELPSEAQS